MLSLSPISSLVEIVDEYGELLIVSNHLVGVRPAESSSVRLVRCFGFAQHCTRLLVVAREDLRPRRMPLGSALQALQQMQRVSCAFDCVRDAQRNIGDGRAHLALGAWNGGAYNGFRCGGS